MKKNGTGKNIAIIVLVLIVIWLLARYVFFKTQIEERSAWLQRIGEWKQNYKTQHPTATDAETDAAFNKWINDLWKRKAQYKAEHPWSTDADADAAFNAAFTK